MEEKTTIRWYRRITDYMPRMMRSKWFYVVALLVAAGAAWSFWGGNGAVPSFETATVERGDVERVISETGTLVATKEVELAFTASGRIAAVLVEKGDQVTEGQVLARLDGAAAAANLAQAQAALRAAEARAGSAGGLREQTIQQQNQLVENAHKALLTNDLRAYLISGNLGSGQIATPPTVTGTYTCKAEGEYRLRLYPSGTQSGFSFSLSGLETGIGSVSTVGPTPIGNCGLFVQFPSNFLSSGEVIWSIPVPNVRSVSYASLSGAYQAALEARELALRDEANAPVFAADIDQARANVRSAQAALANLSILAPFAGVVTNLAITPGEIATPGAPAIYLTSDERFEITIGVPEDDILGIEAGDRAEVTFDALRDVSLEAEVVYVAPAASAQSEFVSFEIVLHLLEEDPRVRSGLTADVDIYAESRSEVIAVPVRAVIEEDGRRFVRVMEGETSYRRIPVAVGLRGGGLYEITAGLEGGERIITFANNAALSALSEVGDFDSLPTPTVDPVLEEEEIMEEAPHMQFSTPLEGELPVRRGL